MFDSVADCRVVFFLPKCRERGNQMGGERDIDDLPKNEANYTALTPLGFLERAALVHPHRKSLLHGSLHYTWLQTYQRCRRLASALSKLSVGFGSTVQSSIPLLKSIFVIFIVVLLDCWCFR